MDYELPENPGCLEVSMGASNDQVLAEPDVMCPIVSDLFNLLAVILRVL